MSRAGHVSTLSHWHLECAAGRPKRDFLTLEDLTARELAALLDLAAEVKAHPGEFAGELAGRAAALIFEKPSLRTRVTFDLALHQLGGHAVVLAREEIGLGRRESAKDVAQNLARWMDALVMRTFAQRVLEDMAAAAEIPVINALSDLLHPCQIVADLLTLRERKGTLRGMRVAFVGDGNNVALSLAQGAARAGMHLAIATPPGYEPARAVFAKALADAAETGAEILLVNDPAEAVADADAVYTDVWASMGQEQERGLRMEVFASFQVDSFLMGLAKRDALFLHCLPAHRGEEVTNEVLDGPHSAVLEQAENRLHAHKAILLAVLSGRPARPGSGIEP